MTWRLSRSTTIALLLSPVGLFLISVTRLLIVSNYNAATALTVASSGGYINTLLGTFIPVVPVFMPYLALALLLLDRTVLGILAFFAAALTSPTAVSRLDALSISERDVRMLSHSQVIEWLILPLAVMLFLEVVGVQTDEFIRTISTIVGLALLPFVLVFYPFPVSSNFYAQELQRPWLPAETISLDSHQNIVGYVLSRGNGWFVVLLASGQDNPLYSFKPGCQSGSMPARSNE